MYACDHRHHRIESRAQHHHLSWGRWWATRTSKILSVSHAFCLVSGSWCRSDCCGKCLSTTQRERFALGTLVGWLDGWHQNPSTFYLSCVSVTQKVAACMHVHIIHISACDFPDNKTRQLSKSLPEKLNLYFVDIFLLVSSEQCSRRWR